MSAEEADKVNILDGEKVTVLFPGDPLLSPGLAPVRAIAVGEHAILRIHGSAATLNASFQSLGFLHPDL